MASITGFSPTLRLVQKRRISILKDFITFETGGAMKKVLQLALLLVSHNLWSNDCGFNGLTETGTRMCLIGMSLPVELNWTKSGKPTNKSYISIMLAQTARGETYGEHKEVTYFGKVPYSIQ